MAERTLESSWGLAGLSLTRGKGTGSGSRLQSPQPGLTSTPNSKERLATRVGAQIPGAVPLTRACLFLYNLGSDNFPEGRSRSSSVSLSRGL